MDFDKKGVGFGRPPFFCAARFLVSASRPVGYAYSCGIPDTIASAVKSGIACPLARDGPPPITSFSIPVLRGGSPALSAGSRKSVFKWRSSSRTQSEGVGFARPAPLLVEINPRNKRLAGLNKPPSLPATYLRFNNGGRKGDWPRQGSGPIWHGVGVPHPLLTRAFPPSAGCNLSAAHDR
jgi:hypothetical protein